MGNITPKEAIANLNHLYGMVAPDIQRSLDVAIKALERPQGEWINREAVSNTIFPFWERYECNQCHKFNGYSNFCPNCGADMRTKESDNETDN